MSRTFDYSYLKSCIDSLSEKRLVFSNELQFQLELSRKFEEEFPDKVYLEVLSCDRDEKKKVYTDIVVETGENEYVAIELKYKAAQCSKGMEFYQYQGVRGPVYLFPQGAYNISCIAYLQDIERLEHLVYGKLDYNMSGGQKKILRGYAVILTNDSLFFSPRDNEDKKDLCREFYINQKKDNQKSYIHGESAKWIWVDSNGDKVGGNLSKEAKARLRQIRMDSKTFASDEKAKNEYEKNINDYPIITLCGNYEVNWHKYCLPEECLAGNPLFMYMISEVFDS